MGESLIYIFPSCLDILGSNLKNATIFTEIKKYCLVHLMQNEIASLLKVPKVISDMIEHIR